MNHTVSLDLARKLQKAGYPQEGSLFYYERQGSAEDYILRFREGRGKKTTKEWIDFSGDISAPTASELLDFCKTHLKWQAYIWYDDMKDEWYFYGLRGTTESKNVADALAKGILYLVKTDQFHLLIQAKEE